MWIAVAVLAGLLLILAVAAFLLYRASQQVPEFYEKALKADSAVQSQASDKMLQKASGLASDLEKRGEWQALFTEEEINGWLAVDLARNHPNAIPEGISAPRVAIAPESLTLACRVRHGNLNGVVSLTVEPYLAEENVIAVRIRKVRIGALPLPLGQVLDRVTEAARQANVRLEWQQADGDPVALFRIPPSDDKEQVRLESLRLGEGEIYVGGTTEKR